MSERKKTPYELFVESTKKGFGTPSRPEDEEEVVAPKAPVKKPAENSLGERITKGLRIMKMPVREESLPAQDGEQPSYLENIEQDETQLEKVDAQPVVPKKYKLKKKEEEEEPLW